MKMFCLKFQQNRTINEEFDSFEAKGPPFINFDRDYYWHTYENVLFKISAKSQLSYMKNSTILRGGGAPGGLRGPLFINFYLNYYWLT